MKTLVEMFRDARDFPRRFWTVYAILCASTLCAAFATALNGWDVFSVAVFVLCSWIGFTALTCAYWIGQTAAYRHMNEFLAKTNWSDAPPLFDKGGRTAMQRLSGFEGPS